MTDMNGIAGVIAAAVCAAIGYFFGKPAKPSSPSPVAPSVPAPVPAPAPGGADDVDQLLKPLVDYLRDSRFGPIVRPLVYWLLNYIQHKLFPMDEGPQLPAVPPAGAPVPPPVLKP